MLTRSDVGTSPAVENAALGGSFLNTSAAQLNQTAVTQMVTREAEQTPSERRDASMVPRAELSRQMRLCEADYARKLSKLRKLLQAQVTVDFVTRCMELTPG